MPQPRKVRIESEQQQSHPPDPAFRYSLELIAKQLHVELIEAKLPQTLLADSIVFVPKGAKIQGTVLDFFRIYNILEFKSQNDPFDEKEFVKNAIRVALFFLQNPKANFENLLNVIVTARYPTHFFKFMAERGFKFETDAGREWQRRYKIGLQEVVVIICGEMPIEEKYFEWLMFAPSDGKTWRDAVKAMVQLGRWELLERVQRIRPKEFAAMSSDFMKVLEQYGPREKRRLNRDRAAAVKIYLDYFKKEKPEMYEQILTEQIRPSLTAEERLAGLDSEQREALLKLLNEQSKSNQE